MTGGEGQERAPGPVLPRWVQVADFVGVSLLLLAIWVAASGGFRTTMLGVRVSVTDWWRPLLVALALIGVRHWQMPAAPLPVRMRRVASWWWRREETQQLLPVVLVTRLGVLAAGALAVAAIGFAEKHPPAFRVYPDNIFLDLPARFDAGWYLSIAIDGYHYAEDGGRRQQSIAFFPAYPLLVRWVSRGLGQHPLWTGVAISIGAFFWALVYVRRLARDALGDEERATLAAVLLASYPFAIFYSAMYTEALFLLAVTAALYHFGRGALWRSALWGGLAGLTRPNGALLSVVLALLVWQRALEARRRDGRLTWLRPADELAAAAAPGVGMLIYSTFVLLLTGRPFQWAAQNAAWGREYRPLHTVLTDRWGFIAENGAYTYASSLPIDLLYLVTAVAVIGAVWPVYRRLGAPYAVLIMVTVLPPLAMGGLLSIGRVTSVLFPVFIWLAAVIPPGHRTAWVAGFAMAQGAVAMIFFTWRPLF